MVLAARDRAAASSAYLAMALFRVNRAVEAKASLRRARNLFKECRHDSPGYLYTEVVIQEAGRLIP